MWLIFFNLAFKIIWSMAYGSTFNNKNPAYGRHQLSRLMQIVGQIQFWRGCVIYRSTPKSELGPRKKAELVHAMVGTLSTQKCWLGSLRNTSPFLGLYSRSRSRLNSGTHPLFRALLEIEIEIEIELWNTSLFLGLYSRSRSRSRSNEGTHPLF